MWIHVNQEKLNNMIKILTFLLLTLCTFTKAFSQVSGTDNDINVGINKSINALNLDSIIVKSKTSTIALSTIDTLVVPIGFVTTFFINLTAENTATQETGGGWKMVQVKNLKGMYYITVNADIVKYAGQSSISTYAWSVISPNNGPPTIQVSGKAISMKYTISRTQNVIAL